MVATIGFYGRDHISKQEETVQQSFSMVIVKPRKNAIFMKNGKTVICRCSTG